MARPTSEELNAIARMGGPTAHARYSELALKRAVDEYLPRRRDMIAPVELRVDGRAYPHLFAALAEVSVAFGEIELRRKGAPPEPARWEFLRPFDRLTVRSQGGSEAQTGPEPARRVMARLLLREQYVPMAAPGERPAPPPSRPSPRPELFSPATLARYLRATGVVPFALAIAVYYPDERVRYEVDLLDSQLEVDPRSRRISPERRVRRAARIGHAVDLLASGGELSMPSIRALETVVETNGLTAVEMAPVFGGVRELGASALDSLVARKLLALDPRSGVYAPRLDAITASVARAPGAASASRVDPRLRSNLAELIAQAEAKASCPLCGDPLPTPRRGILCAKCQSLVGGGSPSAPPGEPRGR